MRKFNESQTQQDYKIIAVDDEEGIIDSLSIVLKRSGYQFTGVTDPVEAIEKIRNEISKKDYDEIIDLSIICDNEFQINFFMPNQDFDNIIIKLTEFSKSQYVNSHILYPDNFDVRGNKMPFEYSKEQRRGNMKYIPPLGWIGIGLNITGYPDWEIRCGHCNKEGEWCVAYHGTDIENAKNIIIEGLKPGKRQAYKDRIDKEGDKIGEGV